MQSRLVLIADDDPATRETLGAVLATFGFRTEAVEDGDALVHAAARQQASAVVTEEHMRGCRGTEALRRIRRLGSQVPAVVVTTHEDDEVADRIRRLGRCVLMHKPVDIAELERQIAALLLQAGAAPRAGA